MPPERILASAALAILACCGDNQVEPCTIDETDGVVTLTCPDGAAQWDVPVCGNLLVEAGEECDDLSRACTDACSARRGVACTTDDAVCVCDPDRFAVPHLDAATFYRSWLDLGAGEAVGHPFTGVGDDPGPEFAMRGDVALDCHLASGAPRVRIAPLRRHALVALPPAAITPVILANLAWVAAPTVIDYTPDRWIGQTLVILDERGPPWAFAVGFHETPCLGDLDDANLLVAYQARGLFCPINF